MAIPISVGIEVKVWGIWTYLVDLSILYLSLWSAKIFLMQ